MSSSDISDVENTKTVLGFQFEPLRKIVQERDQAEAWRSYDEDSGEELPGLVRRLAVVNSWYRCQKCDEMATEKECFCCHELESAHLYELGGKFNLVPRASSLFDATACKNGRERKAIYA